MKLEDLTHINVHFKLNATINWLRGCKYTLLADIEDKTYALKFLNKKEIESLRNNCTTLLALTDNLPNGI